MNRKPKKRKKSNNKKSTLTLIAYTIIILLAAYGSFQLIHTIISRFDRQKEEPLVSKTYRTPDVKFNGKYKPTFDDIQEVQIKAATSLGINPIRSASDIVELVDKGYLVRVGEGKDYDLHADYPYLVPAAADLLEEVRRRYHAKYSTPPPLRLTSCMRTIDSVKGLKRWNPNSVENSCHLYGTTFDISYSRMTQQEKKKLAQVLYELQQGGYCYVKYEVKQPCFHVTVRRPAHISEK